MNKKDMLRGEEDHIIPMSVFHQDIKVSMDHSMSSPTAGFTRSTLSTIKPALMQHQLARVIFSEEEKHESEA